jgi:hypothetical protein
MSTPSPVPLDNFDPVSPYAPRRAHSQNPNAPDEPEHPPGIETDHDARILDEIEASLRAMIMIDHGGDETSRLSDVSRAAAERIAQQQQEQSDLSLADDSASEDTPAAASDDGPQARQPDHDQFAADVASVRAAFRDPRTPPWLLSRSLDPEPIPEPVDEHWPQPRKRKRARSKANNIFLRFGLAATGAAIVAAIAIKDLPSFVMEKIRGPIVELSTNASAVFNEGKASTLQARLDAAQKQDPSSAPSMRYAVANPEPQAKAIPVKTEAIGRAPERRETVMTPWPAPDAVKRPEAAGWQSPPSRERLQPQAREPVQAHTPDPAPAREAPAPARNLSEEEIAMLRKMGDDYTSSGDFVGARTVLERAAEAGDASAAFAIASTYDPVVLARFKVRGLEPDIVKASFWYERARTLGSSEAPHRLQAMMASRSN